MSKFVEECRREWKRLRVPDAVANEMAADLEADLAEAEAEGASAEDVLGNAAFDPRSFAASWAAERGVIQPPPVSMGRPRARSRVFVAIAVPALIAVIGAALLLVAPSGSARLALARPFAFRAAQVTPRIFRSGRVVVPSLRGGGVVVTRPFLLKPPPALAQGFAVRMNVRGGYLHTIGLILLISGIGGLIASTLYWSRRANPSHSF